MSLQAVTASDMDFGIADDDDSKIVTKVNDNCMANHKIIKGDWAIIRKQATAEQGQIVAVPHRGQIILRMNNLYLAQAIGKVEIVGVLAGIVRKY